MSEDTSATGASETASATEGSGTAGSVNEGTSAGSQGDGTSSAASDSGLEARVRAEQGRADRATAELQKAQARLKELESKDSPANDAPAGVTQADLMRMEEMRDVRDALRTQFPLAPQDLTRNYLQYDSPEAMQVAVARAHEAEKADQERRDREAEARVRKQYEERLGTLPPETPSGSEGGEGLPTIAQINSWSMSKQMEFEAKNPGVIAEITEAAMANLPILSANRGN